MKVETNQAKTYARMVAQSMADVNTVAKSQSSTSKQKVPRNYAIVYGRKKPETWQNSMQGN